MLLPDQLGIDLVCPECRRPLARIDHFYLCSDGECRRAYAIVDQIPKLLVEDSQVLDPDDWRTRLDSPAAAASGKSA
ncbi:MAG: hypothetical protein KDA75_10225 [Planctomycetaceae bacterium]|nr:hypothetical protein [Planctomycetaceae bacterium]